MYYYLFILVALANFASAQVDNAVIVIDKINSNIFISFFNMVRLVVQQQSLYNLNIRNYKFYFAKYIYNIYH